MFHFQEGAVLPGEAGCLICRTAACSADGEETYSLWETWLSVSNSLLQYSRDADVLRLFCGSRWIGTVLLRVTSQSCTLWSESGVEVSPTLYEKRNISTIRSLFPF